MFSGRTGGRIRGTMANREEIKETNDFDDGDDEDMFSAMLGNDGPIRERGTMAIKDEIKV